MQAIVLEQPALAFLALPQLERRDTGLLLDLEVAGFEATAPPDTERLHAAPVGIVRLVT